MAKIIIPEHRGASGSPSLSLHSTPPTLCSTQLFGPLAISFSLHAHYLSAPLFSILARISDFDHRIRAHRLRSCPSPSALCTPFSLLNLHRRDVEERLQVGSLLSGFSIAARTIFSLIVYVPGSLESTLLLRAQAQVSSLPSLTCAGLVTVSSEQSHCGLNTTPKASCTTYPTQRPVPSTQSPASCEG